MAVKEKPSAEILQQEKSEVESSRAAQEQVNRAVEPSAASSRVAAKEKHRQHRMKAVNKPPVNRVS